MRALVFVILCAVSVSALKPTNNSTCLCCDSNVDLVVTPSKCFDYGYATATDGQCLSNKGADGCCYDAATFEFLDCMEVCAASGPCDSECTGTYFANLALCGEGQGTLYNCRSTPSQPCCDICATTGNTCISTCFENGRQCEAAGVLPIRTCVLLFGAACNLRCEVNAINCGYTCFGERCPGT